MSLDSISSNNDNYVRIIAHEIRNPLTAIKMAGTFLKEAIREQRDSEMLEIFLDITANNVRKIELLVKKLLELKENELAPYEPVDICQIIDDTLSLANDRIFLQEVTITKNYAPGQFIRGNAEKLTLAFLNIVINAIESMNRGTGKLWIAVYRTEDNVKIMFKDNGAGMEPEIGRKIFDSRVSGKPDGLGFGLKHVKEILDEHKAIITVVSKSGVGTSVIVSFQPL